MPGVTQETTAYFYHIFTGGAGALVLAAAVRALPEPDSIHNTGFLLSGYTWFFRFANGVLINFDLAIVKAGRPKPPE